MRISARNVFAGKVHNVTKGAVEAEITIVLPGGEHIVSIITIPSVDSLELAEGRPAFAIIKASDVIVGKDLGVAKVSARNVLPGEVTTVVNGAVNSEVAIRLAGGTTIVSSITKESVHALKLQAGDQVSAIIKAPHVLIGV